MAEIGDRHAGTGAIETKIRMEEACERAEGVCGGRKERAEGGKEKCREGRSGPPQKHLPRYAVKMNELNDRSLG